MVEGRVELNVQWEILGLEEMINCIDFIAPYIVDDDFDVLFFAEDDRCDFEVDLLVFWYVRVDM